MAHTNELALRLGLTDEQRVILADYTVYRKGENLVRCQNWHGGMVTVKSRHTRLCERCSLTVFAPECLTQLPHVCWECLHPSAAVAKKAAQQELERQITAAEAGQPSELTD